MLSRMGSAELTEWMAFYNLEPFGTDAEYLGHAIVASTVANRGRQKNEKVYKPDEFMPKFERKRQTQAEMLQKAAMFTVAMGGTVDIKGIDGS